MDFFDPALLIILKVFRVVFHPIGSKIKCTNIVWLGLSGT
jgi:hypothetical protein